MNKKLVIITLSTAICMPSYSFAFGMGDITSGLGDITSSITGSGGADNNIDDLEKGQGELADETRKVMVDFISALEMFQDALGLEGDSSLSEIKASCLTTKICSGDDVGDKVVRSSDKVNVEFKNLIDQGVKLSSESSEKFKKGLVSYGKGLVGGGVLGLQISEVIPKYTSAIAVNPLTAPTTLETGLNITKQIPPILTTFSNASGGIYDFATYNGIEIPKVAEAE